MFISNDRDFSTTPILVEDFLSIQKIFIVRFYFQEEVDPKEADSKIRLASALLPWPAANVENRGPDSFKRRFDLARFGIRFKFPHGFLSKQCLCRSGKSLSIIYERRNKTEKPQ
jgi:hypothetical protein